MSHDLQMFGAREVVLLCLGLGEEGFEIPKRDEIEFVEPEIMPLETNVRENSNQSRSST